MKDNPPSTTNGPAPEAEFPQAAKPAWSEDIRAYYQAAATEPVPQDFVDLMAQIARQIGK